MPDDHLGGSRMTIVHVTNTLRVDGTGITNIVVDLAAAMADVGHDVRVICSTSDDDTTALLARHRVEVLHGFDTTTPMGFVGALLRARRTLRESEIVHVHTVRATVLALAASPLRFMRRSVATLHNPYQRTVPLMYAAKVVVSISRVDADHVRRWSRGLRTPAVVLNGLLGTPRLPGPPDVLPAPLAGRPIVYVGALSHRKGVDVLLRAMPAVLERVPEAHLYVVGNRDNPAIEALARDLDLDGAVTFVGFQREPRSLMGSADVFVLPSRAEGFGNVLTEARSMGVPIVASRVGGIPEALDGGDAGVLVDPADPEQLGRALVDVLTDQEFAADLRRRAQAGLEVFRLETAAAAYLDIYRRVLARASR